MTSIPARRLSSEELAARLPGILAAANRQKAEMAEKKRLAEKARKEWEERQARIDNANEIRRAAIQFLADQETPAVGPSLKDKFLEASSKGLRIRGTQGKFLSVKKAAGF